MYYECFAPKGSGRGVTGSMQKMKHLEDCEACLPKDSHRQVRKDPASAFCPDYSEYVSFKTSLVAYVAEYSTTEYKYSVLQYLKVLAPGCVAELYSKYCMA